MELINKYPEFFKKLFACFEKVRQDKINSALENCDYSCVGLDYGEDELYIATDQEAEKLAVNYAIEEFEDKLKIFDWEAFKELLMED